MSRPKKYATEEDRKAAHAAAKRKKRAEKTRRTSSFNPFPHDLIVVGVVCRVQGDSPRIVRGRGRPKFIFQLAGENPELEQTSTRSGFE